MQSEFILREGSYYQLYFSDIKVLPFVKWAGGKRQIISELHNYLPKMIEEKNISYVEPFVGGGAVYFSLFQSPNIEKSILIDNNPILIITYKTIKHNLNDLLFALNKLEKSYKNIRFEDLKSKYYYRIRDEFNNLIRSSNLSKQNPNWTRLSAMFIFLNHTCFNGLYRVNSKGEFNVPRGSYKNPKISDSNNLSQVSMALQKSKILNDDFTVAIDYIDKSSFVYLDPPYRPLKNSSFTSYTKTGFDDNEQKRLAKFCRRIDKLGGKFLLSNSDPKNTDPNDNFFDDLYSGFRIVRINARRNINSNGADRGYVSELLIMNY